LRITTLDGREFIQKAALELWRNPFAPLPSPKPSARKLEKEARRKREADKEQETKEANAGIVETVVQMANMLLGKAQKEPSTPETSAETQPPTPRTISHFVMNLPGSALEFLDAYNGCYAPLLAEVDFPGKDAIDMPIVHVHCFTKEPEGDNARDDICKVGVYLYQASYTN
jgi:tRNA (guanine37-N1)-methyltransferase